MPKYQVQDSESGKTLLLEGDSPPTDTELTELFKPYQKATTTTGTEPPANTQPTSQSDFLNAQEPQAQAFDPKAAQVGINAALGITDAIRSITENPAVAEASAMGQKQGQNERLKAQYAQEKAQLQQEAEAGRKKLQALTIAGGAVEPLTAPGLLNQPSRALGLPDPFQPGKGLLHIPDLPLADALRAKGIPITKEEEKGTGVVAGVSRLVTGTLEGLTTPEMLLTAPFAGESAVIRTLFGYEMLKSQPEAIQHAGEVMRDPESTTADKIEALGHPLVSAYFTRHLLKTPDLLPYAPAFELAQAINKAAKQDFTPKPDSYNALVLGNQTANQGGITLPLPADIQQREQGLAEAQKRVYDKLSPEKKAAYDQAELAAQKLVDANAPLTAEVVKESLTGAAPFEVKPPEEKSVLAEEPKEVVSTAVTPTNLPPVAQGYVRMYHGGSDPRGEGNSPRDASQYIDYAAGYAAKNPESSKVWYVDVPENAPYMKKGFEEFEGGPKAPYINTTIPAEVWRNAKEITPETKGVQDAIPIQETNVGLLRNEGVRGESGLRQVGAPNEVNPQPADTGQAKEEVTSKDYEYKSPYRPVMSISQYLPKGWTLVDENTFKLNRPLTSKEVEQWQLEPTDPNHPVNIKKAYGKFREDLMDSVDPESGAKVTLKDGRTLIVSENVDPSSSEKYPFRITNISKDGTPTGHMTFLDWDEVVRSLWGERDNIEKLESGKNETQPPPAQQPTVESVPEGGGGETKPARSVAEITAELNKQRGIVKRSDSTKKKGKAAIAKLESLQAELDAAQSQTSGAEPTYWSRESKQTDIRKVSPTKAADTGERARLANGEVWEYKGISGYKADNVGRVNGWEKVSKPEPTKPAAAEPKPAQEVEVGKTTAPTTPKTRNALRVKSDNRPPDIIDDILEIGPINVKSTMRKGHEGYYGENFSAVYQGSKGIKGLWKANGLGPDDVVQALRNSGRVGQDFTVDDLWDAIEKGSKSRRAYAAGETPEARTDAFWKAVDPDAPRKGKQKEIINSGDLKTGETITVNGEELTVDSVDTDTNEVYVRGGKKYDRQRIPDGTRIAIDKGSHTKLSDAETEWTVPEVEAKTEPLKAPVEEVRKQPWEMTKDEFENGPPVKQGFVRLWRGESSNPNPKPEGLEERWFSTSRETADFFAANIAGGKSRIVYIDIPTEDLPKYDVYNVLPESEWPPIPDEQAYVLPRDIANTRKHWVDFELHGEKVAEALDQGKPVPAEVLKDYPDLKKEKTPTPKAGGELFGAEEMPFNLSGETATAPTKPAEAPKSAEELAQTEMFAIQKVVASADPVKSADAAQEMYGSAGDAAKKLENQLRVLDSDPKTKKDFSKEQRDRLKEVLALLRQREGQEGAKPVGMGGATPEEFTQPNTVVSNMFAAINRDRKAMGKPEMEPGQVRTWDEDQKKALFYFNRIPDWIPNLIDDVLKEPRPLLSWEQAGTVIQKAFWKAEANNAYSRIAQAFDDGRMEDLKQAQADAIRYEEKIDAMDRAVGKGGTGSEAGRTLNAQKMGLTDDMTLLEMRLKARAAKKQGEGLSKEESDKIAKDFADLQAQNKAIEEQSARRQAEIEELSLKLAEEKAARAEAGEGPPIHPTIMKIATDLVAKLNSAADSARERIRLRREAAARGEILQAGPLNPADLDDYAIIGASHLANKIIDLAKWTERMISDLGEIIQSDLEKIRAKSEELIANAQKFRGGSNAPRVKKAMEEPTTADIGSKIAKTVKEKWDKKEKDKISFYLQQLARQLYKDGIRDRDERVDAMYDIIKEELPNITRREVARMWSGYGDYRQLSKDEISVALRKEKGELLEISKLEDMAEGKPPMKSGVARGETSEARRKLIKMVNDAKFKFQVPIEDPNTQLKSALDTYKTILRNRITDLEDRMARKDFTPRIRRELILDEEADTLKAKAQRTQQRYQKMVEDMRKANREPWQRVFDSFVKWERAFKLSSPVVFGKLGAAAITRGVTTAAEEVIGAGLSRLPIISQIAARAPREGGSIPIRQTLMSQLDKGGREVTSMSKGLARIISKGIADSKSTAKTGMTDLDMILGKEGGIDNEWVNMFGQLHGMMKAPIKRLEYEYALQKRINFAVKNGEDVLNKQVMTRLMAEAMNDGYRTIFMQKGLIADTFNAALSMMERSKKYQPSGEILARTARFLLPIVRVPMNIVTETGTGVHGVATASARTMYHIIKGNLDSLDPKVADSIMRQFKKGSIGLGLMALGYLNPQNVGGYDWRDKKKPGEVKTGGFQVFGMDIPRWMTHAPWFELMQFGATIRHATDHGKSKGAGLLQSVVGLTEQTPFYGEAVRVTRAGESGKRFEAFAGDMARSTLVPQALIKIAELTDPIRYPWEEGTKRYPTSGFPINTIHQVSMGIPGLRQTVPDYNPNSGPQPKKPSAVLTPKLPR